MAPSGGGAIAGLGNMLTGAGRSDTPNFSGGIIGRLGAIEKLERRAASGGSALRGELNLAGVAKMNSAPGTLRNFSRAGTIVDSALGGAATSLRYDPSALSRVINKSAFNAGSGTIRVEGKLTTGERRYMDTMGVRGIKSRNFMQSIVTSGGGVEMRTMGGTVSRTASFGIATISMTEKAEKLIRPLAGVLEKNPRLLDLALSRGNFAGGQFTASMADDVVKARSSSWFEFDICSRYGLSIS